MARFAVDHQAVTKTLEGGRIFTLWAVFPGLFNLPLTPWLALQGKEASRSIQGSPWAPGEPWEGAVPCWTEEWEQCGHSRAAW